MTWNPLDRRFPDPPDGPFEDVLTCGVCGTEVAVEAVLDVNDPQSTDGETDRGEVRVLIAHGSTRPAFCPVCDEDSNGKERGRWL